MGEISVHPSVSVTWSLANRFAWIDQSERIELVHFYLATLQVIDGAIRVEGDKYQLTPQQFADIEQIGKRCKDLLGKSDEQVTQERRQLRKQLNIQNTVSEPTGLLHRSEQSRAVFREAINRAAEGGRTIITLEDLVVRLLPYLPDAITSYQSKNDGQNKGPESIQSNPNDVNSEVSEGLPDWLTKPDHRVESFGKDLTALAWEGRLTPIVGREAEMLTITRILHRTSKRNVILVGDPGVGKTAIVEGLALKLAQDSAPEYLRSVRIVQLSIADLVAGTMYRGELERRLQRIITEATNDPNIVLFLDEIHLVMKTGATGESGLDVANILKPALARDDFRCIGATTIDEYERFIKDDGAFKRRFQVLHVHEPTAGEAKVICSAWAKRIEQLRMIKFDDDAVNSAVTLSQRYIKGRFLPDKAIDLLENAAARMKIASLDFAEIVEQATPTLVTSEVVRSVIEEEYGITTQADGLVNPEKLGSLLKSEIIGQPEAIAAVMETLQMVAHNRENEKKPAGILLFCGPTGSGKTMTANLLARCMVGDDSNQLLEFSMNEYKESYDLSRLIGAAPGLIGHDHQGPLFGFCERCPQGVILLDEFEKAHPDVRDFFMQIFDTGQARDSRGRVTSFQDYIFILTANFVEISENAKGPVNWINYQEVEDLARASLAQTLRPELLARIERVIVYKPLGLEDYQEIFTRLLGQLCMQIDGDGGFTLETDESTKMNIVLALSDNHEGARGFIRRFNQKISVPVHKLIHEQPRCDTVHIQWISNELLFVAR